MLERLDDVPWATLEHAYGTAEDVPDLLRALLSPDAEVRAKAEHELYGNLFHQGTRYPATAHVVPFLIEMCADPAVPDRASLLTYWGYLITGQFSVRERPQWGDGENLYDGDEIQPPEDYSDVDWFAAAVHAVYAESLRGFDLACALLDDRDPAVRAGAAWVLACLRTRAVDSIPLLVDRGEPVDDVRATIAFALGELGVVEALGWLLADDSPAVRCMAACQLARLDPTPELCDTLLDSITEPIVSYDRILGTGGESAGDAVHAVSLLPPALRERMIPPLCDRLDQVQVPQALPLIETILGAAFVEQQQLLTALTENQHLALTRLVNCPEVWTAEGLALRWTFGIYGLPYDRPRIAELLGVRPS